MQRREFLKVSFTATASTFLLSNIASSFSQDTQLPHAVWVSDGEPKQLLNAALDAYGGMKNFISKGDVVVVKPNIGWDRAPQFAANTNPELVGATVEACLNAGASKVKIFDRTCNNPRRCYRNSEIESTAEKYGADVEQIRDYKFTDMRFPEGELIKNWPIYKEYLETDKIINLPIAKHHSMARATLGLKNLMGVMGGNRGSLHNHFDKKLIDIDAQILPTLTIVDAYRILLRNGPVGGNLNDVKLTKTLIMSPCTVTADYLSLDLFGLKLEQISHVKEAYQRGLNQYDRDKLNLKKISLS